jgi:hypothetical protein
MAGPRILEQLRPEYGRMGNPDGAQAGNIRLLARSGQPSLTQLTRRQRRVPWA